MTRSFHPMALLFVAALGAAPGVPADPPATRPRTLDRLTNSSPDFTARLELNSPDLVYEIGSTMSAKVAAGRDGFAYLFHEDTEGAVTLLYPYPTEADNAVKATPRDAPTPAWHPLPPAGVKSPFRIAPPAGREFVKAVVSSRRIDALDKAVAALPAGRFLAVDGKLLDRAWGELTGLEGARPAPDDAPGRKLQFGNLGRTQDWAEHGLAITVVEKGGGGARARGGIVELSTGKPIDPPPVSQAGPRRVGVFVGISEYKASQVKTLQVSHTDARVMAERLARACGFHDTKVLLNADATYARVEDLLARQLPAATRPGDEVVIYWSGHGGHLPEAGLNRPYWLYLVPHDGVPASADSIRTTMILDVTFGRWLQALEGRRVVVILDTCHSGGVVELKADPAARDAAKTVPLPGGIRATPKVPDHFLADAFRGVRNLGQRELWVLASSKAEQVSFEWKEKGHGAMTYYLLEALDKLAAPVTVADVAKYVQAEVPKFVERKKYPGTQTPVFDGPNTPIVVLRQR